MQMVSRRRFLGSSLAAAAGCEALAPHLLAGEAASDAAAPETVAFFLVGDTHYLAERGRPARLADRSRTLTSRLVDHLNRLPGTAIPDQAGGGKVGNPQGLLHAGDLIDSGDKNGKNFRRMQETELAAYIEDFGLNGRDGRLRFPVYEVHGNHDGPQGTGPAPDAIRRRNKNRPGVVNVSADGLHYSWDWHGIHFVSLGIVVGAAAATARRRRYHPHGSLAFLEDDLARRVGDSGRPVMLLHHIDVARYSLPCDPQAPAGSHEWDPCDVRAYHQALRNHAVLGILYGHTHVRRVFRWDGTRNPAATGIPVFNTDNAAHFDSRTQAFLYFEIGAREMVVREFATTDEWATGTWTPTVWRFPVRRG